MNQQTEATIAAWRAAKSTTAAAVGRLQGLSRDVTRIARLEAEIEVLEAQYAEARAEGAATEAVDGAETDAGDPLAVSLSRVRLAADLAELLEVEAAALAELNEVRQRMATRFGDLATTHGALTERRAKADLPRPAPPPPMLAASWSEFAASLSSAPAPAPLPSRYRIEALRRELDALQAAAMRAIKEEAAAKEKADAVREARLAEHRDLSNRNALEATRFEKEARREAEERQKLAAEYRALHGG